MKTLTTMTAAAALIAGMSFAAAQNTSGTTTNPSSINAAPTTEGNTGKSGSQPQATKDMPGGAKTMPRQQTQSSENNADINKKPTDSGMASKSGSQPKATTNMPGGKSAAATTGSSASSNVTPNDKGTDNGKLKVKDLAK